MEHGHFMTIDQKFDTFLRKTRNKIFLKSNNFKQLSPKQNWHLFCLLKGNCVLDFGLNYGFGLQKIRFGTFHEGIIHQLDT